VVSEAPCRVNELGITMCFAQHDERLTNSARCASATQING
jgi:homoaconitase/3-isopropylmalate dehydratase large subunit